MGSIKIIIIILCVVGFIIRTIAGDAKRDRQAQAQPATPQPRVPKIPVPPTVQQEAPRTQSQPLPSIHNVESGSIGSTSPMVVIEPVDEEAQQAELDRWRRALIDSEILKTKF